MARLGRLGFLGVAVVFHLVYIYSIFDIYFVSPIVSGMTSFGVERDVGVEAPAQRLVLFVGDGLRADKAFQSFPDPSPSTPDAPEAEEPRPLAPFLRSRVLKHGTFGVSHTRVPTESRPGHVALIAGLYEDVSAVTTGWKLNPVNFDSVFNRSRHTWSWGSPDILPMFREGAVEGRIDADVYGKEAEDFTQDATELDTWVFEKVKQFFHQAARNATLDAALRENQNVFFLHLLGLDTAGHAYRPYSKEYLHNIKVVDKGIEEITKLIDDFYADGKTAFVFTADHGMTDWGSHGDGHPDNTRTPLIAWGSGVAKPNVTESGAASGHEDGFSADWGLDHIQRHDVSQADIAALMAYLAGLEFPVNSVGELPLSYLASDSKEKAEAALANAKGVLEMYRVKEEQKRKVELRYRPFPPLGNGERSVNHRMAEIRAGIDQRQFSAAIIQSQELLHLGLNGLRYLQTYDWLFLRALVTMGYLGWIAFALTTVMDLHVVREETRSARTPVSNAAFGAISTLFFSFLWIRKAPITFYAYAFFPLIFWEGVFARKEALVKGGRALFEVIQSKRDLMALGIKTFVFTGLLEALVISYFYRSVYTLCYILAALWPLTYGQQFLVQNQSLIALWVVACLSMSIFTMLPAVKTESSDMISLGGALMVSVGVLYLIFKKRVLASKASNIRDLLSESILGAQIGLIMLAMFVTRSSAASLQAKQGLPLGNQVVGWLILAVSLVLPFLHGLRPNHHYLHRLVVIFLTFSPVFIILTISYEGLFYFIFCVTLATWVRLEHQIYNSQVSHIAVPPSLAFTSPTSSPAAATAAATPPATARTTTTTTTSHVPLTTQHSSPPHPPSPHAKETPSYRPLTLADFRPALFFFFLVQSAFFSTGNIASISSFSLDSVYRLIPVFNPFSQGALLVLKLLIPFALISANLGILTRRLGVAPSSLFMLVSAFSDVLTMNFFWMVRDEGSWLDIGSSISHFCIASLLCVFVAGLEVLSEVFVSGVRVGGEEDGEEEGGNGKGKEGGDGQKGLAPLEGEGEGIERKKPIANGNQQNEQPTPAEVKSEVEGTQQKPQQAPVNGNMSVPTINVNEQS